jgi:hypothetical protein
MRSALLLTTIVLAAYAAAAPVKHHAGSAPAASSLPSFSFMGHTPTVVEPNPVGADGKPCTQNAKSVVGDLSCTDYEATLAGEDIRGFISTDYYQGQLYHVFGEGTEAHYPTILSAFTAKYGEPKMGSEPWESKGGAKFDNTIATWKFRDGTLHLDQMGLSRDEFSFEFYSKTGRPPAPAAKVDF